MLTPTDQPQSRGYRGWKVISTPEGLFVAVDPANRPIEPFPRWTPSDEIDWFIDLQIERYN